jgi:hypothetical protein
MAAQGYSASWLSLTPAFRPVRKASSKRKPFKRLLMRARKITGLKAGVNESAIQ